MKSCLGFTFVVTWNCLLASVSENVAKSHYHKLKKGDGPWLDRIIDIFGSKNFHSLYNKYFRKIDSEGKHVKRFETPKPSHLSHQTRTATLKEKPLEHLSHRIWKEKKWVNVKIVNQIGGRVRIKPDKILPSTSLDDGEIFVYHRLLKPRDRKRIITLKAFDAYSDKPLMLNGDFKFGAKASTYDETQETYITRPGKLGNKWMYVKLINEAGGKVKVAPNKILSSMTLNEDETQIDYSRLEPGDKKKKIILTAVDVKTKEPLKLNREYTLALRPDDAGNVATVKITRGDTVNARCDGFKAFTDWRGNEFEYQIVVDREKNWFDALRSCQVCEADLLSIQSKEENEFITKALRRTSEVNKLWIGMTFYIKTRMWTWSDGRQYRFTHWKEGMHYDGPDEQCGVIYQQYDWGRWDDDNCYKTQGFICKRVRKRQIKEQSKKEKEVEDSGPFQDCRPSIECPSVCRMVVVAHNCQKCDCGSLVQEYKFANGTGRLSFYKPRVFRNNYLGARDPQTGSQTAELKESGGQTRLQLGIRQSNVPNIIQGNPQRSVMGFEPIKGVLQQRHLVRGPRSGLSAVIGDRSQHQSEAQTLSQSQSTRDLPPKALVREIMGLIDTIGKPAVNDTLADTRERIERS